jgi:hypothetical protein
MTALPWTLFGPLPGGLANIVGVAVAEFGPDPAVNIGVAVVVDVPWTLDDGVLLPVVVSPPVGVVADPTPEPPTDVSAVVYKTKRNPDTVS